MNLFTKTEPDTGIRGALVGAVILFAIVALAYAPFAFGDRTLASSSAEAQSIYPTGAGLDRFPVGTLRGLDPGAAAWQTEPAFLLEHQQITDEHVAPLWNPYVGYGEPLAANMLAQPFYPLAWLPIADPSPRAYNWFIILRFYLAALFTFLYLRFFVRFAAALGGAIAFAFTGYLILYFNIAHLSVECLIPGLFFTMEWLVRRRDALATVCAALMIAAVVVGGMPESALLAFAFAYLYLLVRVVTDAPTRSAWRSIFGRIIAATVLGLGMSACLLLPGYEFLKLSLNQHQAEMIGGTVAGSVYDPFALEWLVPYVTPLIYGPPWTGIFGGWTGVRGFVGVAQLYFATLTIIGMLAAGIRRIERPWSPRPYVFAIAVVLLMKRFGSPLVNWIGLLPGFSLINFPKYDEPLIGFCVAILTAFGIEEVASGRVSLRRAWFAAFVQLAILTVVAGVRKSAYLSLPLHGPYTVMALTLALGVAIVVAVLTYLPHTTLGKRWLPALAFACAAVVAGEGVASYLVPLWYVIDGEAPISRSAANGAPYIAFVQAQTKVNHFRFYGEDYLLMPEWSSAFQISDVRDLNALYDFRYMRFLQAFLEKGPQSELVDRFTGQNPFAFDSDSERRFLQLSSIGYVATQRHLGHDDPSLLGRAILSRPRDVGPDLRTGTWAIGDVRREAVFMQAPRLRYPVPVRIPRSAKTLHYAIAIDPGAWAKGAAACGGVTFVVQLRTSAGNVATLGAGSLDPARNAGDRRWVDVSASVRAWAGSDATLLFSTIPEPRGNPCAPWALWSDVRFDVTPPAMPPGFELAYSTAEGNIYRYGPALPRLAVYTGVASVATDDAALELLRDPHFDPTTRAVITNDGVAAQAGLAALSPSAGTVEAGAIDLYQSQHVHATVEARRPSLAVLNDIVFPGWIATVDGTEVPIVTTNYLFRGVVVPPGRHSLDFWYRPRSFLIGSIVTMLSFVVTAMYLGLALRRRFVRSNEPGRVDDR